MICGWRSAASVLASCRKFCTKRRSASSGGCRILSATSRSSVVSTALNTVAKPPAPSSSTIRYLPSCPPSAMVVLSLLGLPRGLGTELIPGGYAPTSLQSAKRKDEEYQATQSYSATNA